MAFNITKLSGYAEVEIATERVVYTAGESVIGWSISKNTSTLPYFFGNVDHDYLLILEVS